MLYFTINCYTVTKSGESVMFTGPVDGISKEDAIERFIDDMGLDKEDLDIEISDPIWYEEYNGVNYPNSMLN